MTDRSIHRPIATVYGYPRQGAERQLKKATESYWAGRIDAAALMAVTRDLRLDRLRELRAAGLGELPSNDFSLYDHVLDAAVMLGAIPRRHLAAVPDVTTTIGRLDRYFAMARGTSEVAPLEMTKWFDTNYHYLVPELGPRATFTLDSAKPVSEFVAAKNAGMSTRPVILGPVSFLLLAKPDVGSPAGFAPLDLLDRVLPCYVELLGELRRCGAQWTQFDEPVLVMDQPDDVLDAVERAYATLSALGNRPKLLVASYFDQLGDALAVLARSAVDGLAMDFTGPAEANLAALANIGGLSGKRLVAGVVDGRNVWTTDLDRALTTLESLRGLAGEVDVASSCSLLHVPLDVDLERDLDPLVLPWLSFARQKLRELVLLATGLADGRAAISNDLRQNHETLEQRARSPIVHVAAVRARSGEVRDSNLHRQHPYQFRHPLQQEHLQLPVLPTTTIGSFPQTARVRQARAALIAGTLEGAAYEQSMRDEIRAVIAEQEALGLDVLVHGEPERNDMVQYFAEQLDGFLATSHGWVQSYGSRYVRPPILAGDVARPEAMTVRWAKYAQSLTNRPVKGMLTGPVTMLAWSFVRDDQALGDTAIQVALALRDEVLDLERAGIAIIQVDEPALRETLPLRRESRSAYLEWAVRAFLITTAGVQDETQIHTHMCYAEFGDILPAIVAMDADVISLEAARSQMEIVTDLAKADYPNEIGPGVWDIHSPRVPSSDELADRLRAAVVAFPAERLWVNPDCGLKTRGYREVLASLANLVEATERIRIEHQ